MTFHLYKKIKILEKSTICRYIKELAKNIKSYENMEAIKPIYQVNFLYVQDNVIKFIKQIFLYLQYNCKYKIFYNCSIIARLYIVICIFDRFHVSIRISLSVIQ